MVSVKATSEWLDNETTRLLVNSVTAAGICWAVGAAPKQAAALAAISTAGISLSARGLNRKERPIPSRNNGEAVAKWEARDNRQRLKLGTLLTPVVLIAGRLAGLHAGWKGTGAALAGVLGGTYLWSYSKTQHVSRTGPARLPVVASILIGWMVGKVWPQWCTPLQGAMLAGLTMSSGRAHTHATIYAKGYWFAPALYPFSLAAIFASPWAATKLGVAADLNNLACVMVANAAAQALFILPQNLWNQGAEDGK